MIGVIGAPAQGDLTEITGAQHNTAEVIGHVHQYLGAFPGLRVFIGDGMVALIVSDIPEMQAYSLMNRDFPGGDVQLVHQCQRVLVSAIRGAEAGHGNSKDMRARQLKTIHGAAGSQQCQRGVQSTGNPDHYLTAGNRKTPRQGGRLQVKDLTAALVTRIAVCGNKGIGGRMNGRRNTVVQHQRQRQCLQSGRTGEHALCRIQETGLASSVSADPVQIDIGIQPVIIVEIVRVFRERASAGRHQAVPGEHQVGGGLSQACGDIGIGTLQTRALLTDQVSAVLTLGNQLIGCGQVQHQLGTGQRQVGTGRDGGPEILTDFNAEHDPVLAAEYSSRRNGKGHAADFHGVAAIPAALEIAFFVELVGVGNILLGYKPVDRVGSQDKRTVEKAGFRFQGRTDHGNHGIGQGLREADNALLDGLKQ